jgi:hypothetical protein
MLVPTRSLPDKFDVPHPFALAPSDRVDVLLAAYHDAGTASAQAITAVAQVAADIHAPSRILTEARAAVRAGAVSAENTRREAAKSAPQAHLAQEFPGPVERPDRVLIPLRGTRGMPLFRKHGACPKPKQSLKRAMDTRDQACW